MSDLLLWWEEKYRAENNKDVSTQYVGRRGDFPEIIPNHKNFIV